MIAICTPENHLMLTLFMRKNRQWTRKQANITWIMEHISCSRYSPCTACNFFPSIKQGSLRWTYRNNTQTNLKKKITTIEEFYVLLTKMRTCGSMSWWRIPIIFVHFQSLSKSIVKCDKKKREFRKSDILNQWLEHIINIVWRVFHKWKNSHNQVRMHHNLVSSMTNKDFHVVLYLSWLCLSEYKDGSKIVSWIADNYTHDTVRISTIFISNLDGWSSQNETNTIEMSNPVRVWC